MLTENPHLILIVEDDISKCKALGIDDYWIKTDIARKDIIEKLQNYFLS